MSLQQNVLWSVYIRPATGGGGINCQIYTPTHGTPGLLRPTPDSNTEDKYNFNMRLYSAVETYTHVGW